MRVLGLNSGTSLDSIDTALVELEVDEGTMRLSVIDWTASPWPGPVRAQLRHLADPAVTLSAGELALASVAAGEAFAAAASNAIRAAGLEMKDVAVVASHGQTVHHAVDDKGRALASLQIGEPAVIAERTGRTVVADFRPRDIAAGGQGAPLVGFLDALLFGEPDRTVGALNVGGIANVTLVPAAAPLEAAAWDTGPGNTLIDALARRVLRRPCDEDGAVAASGKAHEWLLKELLAHEYYARRPPKSTGRELFGEAMASALVKRGRVAGMPDADLMATVTELTARTIARGIRGSGAPWPAVLHVAGGGTRNPTLMRGIEAALIREAPPGVDPPEVRMVDAAGIPAAAKEAILFAVLGHEALHGRPNTLPGATGARRAAVLGAIWPGDGFRELMDGASRTGGGSGTLTRIAVQREIKGKQEGRKGRS
ncbi:MAG: anhydro-N-acetylmuramic acid kinase [Chloroflexi bacterium]|nr:anhydro-N-acetylmuramic acid kinase [Chloroflexota bacterium]